MDKRSKILFLIFAFLGLVSVVLAIVFLVLAGGEYEKARSWEKEPGSTEYPLEWDMQNFWADSPGKLGRKIEKSHYYHHLKMTADQFKGLYSHSVPEVLNYGMEVTAADSYVVGNTATTTKSPEAQVDVNFGNYDVLESHRGRDHGVDLVIPNICQQKQWKILKDRKEFEETMQGFFRFYNMAQNDVLPYLATQKIVEEDGALDNFLDNVLPEGVYEQDFSDDDKRRMWSDPTFGLGYAFNLLRMAYHAEVALPLEFVNYFGIRLQSDILELRRRVFITYDERIYNEMAAIVQEDCTHDSSGVWDD